MLVAGDVSAPAMTDTAAAAADEWQLVSRGASKKKKTQQQRSGSRHSAAPSHHALVDVVAAKSSSSTTSSGYKYKAHNNRDRHRHGSIDASDGRVSSAKQSAIERRVAQIAVALRESKLIVDAVCVIDAHFKLQAAVAADTQQDDSALTTTLPTEAPVVHLVSYGLGSFCSSMNAVYQLAYAKALLDALRERSIDAKNSVAEIFDPVMNKSDIAIAECFGFSTIQQNECGKRAASSNTVFFMPHCGKTLYQNVLASNWGKTAQQLTDVIIIGNSFEAYSDRLINAAARRASVLVGVLPYLSETPLETGLSKAHDEFALYEAAFNDLSIHVFPAVRAQEALLNAALTLQMAEIADADQAAAGGQDEELIV